MEEMRQVVKILPNRGLYRVNLAIYAAYSGDGPTAEQESRNALDQSPWALQSLALAQTLQGQVAQAARDLPARSAKSEELGPSYTASGLGDLALYEGRFSEAARILTQGAAADLAAKDPDRAANKLAALAYAELLRQRKPAAIAAAEKALATSQDVTFGSWRRVSSSRRAPREGQARSPSASARSCSPSRKRSPRLSTG